MAGLRIGIDVGGTFTHGVVLKPPGEVLATARTPTTHTHEHGVAGGIEQVLRELLAHVDTTDVALVAHSTTQATNALLEGDVSPVIRAVVTPPGEGALCRFALRGSTLNLGSGNKLYLTTRFTQLEDAQAGSVPDERNDDCSSAASTSTDPVAVIQPQAGGATLRERELAETYAAAGHPTVCASEITQVLGLAARARTATVNASMLPTMLATADYTESVVAKLLPGVPVMVVRSDGGAMSIDEMRRQPILSLLSGPAAGASAALDRTGLSEVVFIEVGGTSTDITLIKGGRVRHRHATVGGQRLMVPALDLRTVAVGGGSMLRADGSRFGPRSAHIAGMPYLFQAIIQGRNVVGRSSWTDPLRGGEYVTAQLDDGSSAAITLTDTMLKYPEHDKVHAMLGKLGISISEDQLAILRGSIAQDARGVLGSLNLSTDFTPVIRTAKLITVAVRELIRLHNADLPLFTVVGGGGGAPVILEEVARQLKLKHQLVESHAVISAIGAATAVTCASQSKTIAKPSGQDIAQLTEQVEERLRAQGAERLDTQYEYDPHRQVLTVTGRGSRAYEQDAQAKDDDELAAIAQKLADEPATLAWRSDENQLWVADTKRPLACVLDRHGRSLWVGHLREWFAAESAERQSVLDEIIDKRTAYTDGGPALPGLALICAGRFIPLDQLGSRELITEVLRWENLPTGAPGCFIIRA
jgi:N-methylhydantoinase A/oxoprolinase/acetone carboxylase beta subunit